LRRRQLRRWKVSEFKVIAISGKQGSGKSTLSNQIASKLLNVGWNVLSLKFAAPIYEMQDAVLRVARTHGLKPDAKEGRLMQLIGTEWGRERFGHDVWTRCLVERLHHLKDTRDVNTHTLVVIDDLRFGNELTALDMFGGVTTVRLECAEELREERCNSWRGGAGLEHSSETSLDSVTGWDRVFYTSKPITDGVIESLLGITEDSA
jgi:hypothetical protein